MVEVPPVNSRADLPPSAKLDFTAWEARVAARRRGDMAAPPAAPPAAPKPKTRMVYTDLHLNPDERRAQLRRYAYHEHAPHTHTIGVAE